MLLGDIVLDYSELVRTHSNELLVAAISVFLRITPARSYFGFNWIGFFSDWGLFCCV